ncbi:MAG: CIA30 family protein [Saprospiraceae bacterium]|nr:CIA30 family protein [Saprospiraceae bacterium]
MVSTGDITIYNFDKQSDPSDWRILDDGVMGGLSQGRFFINDEGYGIFKGKVRLENNGGFSSVRFEPHNIQVTDQTTIKIKLKGDGKKYQFRIRSNPREYHSYIYNFQTSGVWETIEINLADMYPSWRGRRLNMDNFSTGPISEIGFLIGNKKPESFELQIDNIQLD